MAHQANSRLSLTSMFPGRMTEYLAKFGFRRLRTLSIVLQDGEIVSSESGLGDEQRTQIRDILDGCGNVLRDLEKVVNNYGELKSGTGSFGDRVKRVWKKLNWEPEDVRELRARVTSNIGLLNVFLARISR